MVHYAQEIAPPSVTPAAMDVVLIVRLLATTKSNCIGRAVARALPSAMFRCSNHNQVMSWVDMLLRPSIHTKEYVGIFREFIVSTFC